MQWSVTGVRTLRRLGFRSMPPYLAASCCSCALSTSIRLLVERLRSKGHLPQACRASGAGGNGLVCMKVIAMHILVTTDGFAPKG